MAPMDDARVGKAFSAMKEMGISLEKVKPALKQLLRLYKKKWEVIEADDYKVLVHSIFDTEKVDEKMHNGSLNSQAEKPKTDAGELIECPSPEFNSFGDDKMEQSFAVNQIWAVYDTIDSMPRFYAKIMKVFSPGFKLLITWLNAQLNVEGEQRWIDNGLPVACGRFKNGDTEEVVDPLIFSHQMHCLDDHKGLYIVYPKKGETWALFRGWDIKWSLEPEKHLPPYEFAFSEILSDYIHGVGIRVCYLSKVKGFTSLFQRIDEIDPICISPSELYRFSHQIPSFRMAGKEKEGVPVGSFELDPASISSVPLALSYAALEKESLNAKENGSISKSNISVDVEPPEASQSVLTLKKNENCHQNEPSMCTISTRKSHKTFKNEVADHSSQVVASNSQSCLGACTSYQTSETLMTPRKQTNNEDVNPNASKSNPESIDERMATAASSAPSSDKKCRCPMDENSVDRKKQRVSLRGNIVEVVGYEFEKERAEDKYQLGQIWALWSDEDGLPKKYGQIKKIESNPHFILHVAMLKSCSPLRDTTRPVSCGDFTVASDEIKLLNRSQFSHKVKAIPICKGKYYICPRKGQIWAVYKNVSNNSMHSSVEECNIVQVLEETELSVKLETLKRINDSEPFYEASRIQTSETSISDIPESEFYRFSHQCVAFQNSGQDRHLNSIWELDVKSIPGTLAMLD